MNRNIFTKALLGNSPSSNGLWLAMQAIRLTVPSNRGTIVVDTFTSTIGSEGKIDYTVNTRIQEHMISGFRLIQFLFIGYLMRNQPEDVLNMFLNCVSEILHYSDSLLHVFDTYILNQLQPNMILRSMKSQRHPGNCYSSVIF